MDPAATKSASSADSYQDYTPFSSPPSTGGGARANNPVPPQSAPLYSTTVSSLVRALELAADRTATTIAHGTKQTRREVRERLNEVVNWLITSLRNKTQIAAPVPPVIAREYVSTLKVNFLSELAVTPDLNAGEVVSTLIKLDEAEDAWRRTDRGKFISRLTGADCADAVVAIAHDIRSPLCSILLLVDALRRAEKMSPNPIRERQLGLIYGAAFGLSTTVSNLIGAARGDGLVQGQPLPFSVSETMHSVSAIVQPMCEEKGIPLAIEFPENDARIGHASAIQQSLLNLASNALRYTDAGSVARMRSTWPLFMSLRAFFVRSIGNGQLSPLASSSRSICIACSIGSRYVLTRQSTTWGPQIEIQSIARHSSASVRARSATSPRAAWSSAPAAAGSLRSGLPRR